MLLVLVLESAAWCFGFESHESDKTNVAVHSSNIIYISEIIPALWRLILAKRATAGVGATQWLGQMSDAALQQVSRDRGILGGVAKGKKMQQSEMVPNFENRYGEGHKLS